MAVRGGVHGPVPVGHVWALRHVDTRAGTRGSWSDPDECHQSGLSRDRRIWSRCGIVSDLLHDEHLVQEQHHQQGDGGLQGGD